jgi:MscS family membrane protein
MLCWLMAALLVPSASGQLAQGVEPPETPAAEPTPTPVPVPEGLESPRATMRTFLEAFVIDEASGKPRLEDAARCLDLSEIPEVARDRKGVELAVQLKDVIDRIAFVELETIPEDVDSGRYVWYRDPAAGPVAMVEGEDGGWRFAPETLQALPALLAMVEGRQVVEGVTEAPRDLTVGTWLRSRMPPSLRSTTFILANWQWLGLALLVVLGMVVGHLVTFLTRLVADSALRRRLVRLDTEQVHPVFRPVGLFVMGVLWWFGLQWLELPVSVFSVLVIAAQFVIALAGVVALYRAVDVLTAILWERAQRTENRFDDLLVPFLGKALKVVVLVFGLVFIADTLGAPVKTLLAGLGIGGLAFALAAKDTLSNLFGSLTVLLDRPFSVGDWIVTGDVEGTVEVVGFRSTRIRTFYNSQITLPNSNLTNVAVDNLGARQYRRWSTTLSLTYTTAPERIEAFCEGVRELIRSHPYTRKDYYHVYFNEFGGSSLNVLLYVFFETPDWATELRERHRLGVDIIRLAHRLGVDFAFPTQTIYWIRGSDEVAEAAVDTAYGDRVSDAVASSRAEARRLLDISLGGSVPPPVSYTAQRSDDDASTVGTEGGE